MTPDDRSFDARVAQRTPGGDVEALLRRVHELVETARPAPLSTHVKVDRDELLDLLDHAIERLPDEVRAARWLMKDRDEFLARTQREADDILAAARGQAERMVQRSEVLKSADAKARRIVEQAREEASRLRNECDDYCDQRLAQLETVLERTLGVVANGRAKLRGPMPDLDEDDEVEDDDEGSTSPFFDQDRV
jgi:cell division septum initiation protein DivIVA